MKNIYEKIIEIQKGGQNAVVCTIVNTKGSTPRKTGAKMIVYANGQIFGTIGGGELEKAVINNALERIKENEPKIFRHDLLHQHGMCCGGTVDIFVEPVMKKRKLYIFGAGHTGKALAKFSVDLDFETVLIDDRKEYLEDFNIAGVNKMRLPFAEALQLLPFDEQTYICIMTYSHPVDRNILACCLKKPFAYLGMIGSKRKVEMTKKMFSDGLNISEQDLEKVDMPMGIDIKAEGPDEIALSILAKLIAVKNNVTTWEKELQL
ncbi:MAG: XdhC family protein [Bacteroidetes bacterium]|nr:MAG: XdhC family protein [Bacteroidota bacterium]